MESGKSQKNWEECKIKRMQHGNNTLWKGYKIKKVYHEKQANIKKVKLGGDKIWKKYKK